MRRTLILLSNLSVCLAVTAGENFIQEGSFAGGQAGGPPPAPWVIPKEAPGVAITLEPLPGSADGKLWVHCTDESPDAAATLLQKFSEISAGRLSFKLHIADFRAAIWFLLGQQGRKEASFAFKVTSKGGLLVGTADGMKIANEIGAPVSFTGGETCGISCTFQPTAGQSGYAIEIARDGNVVFRGKTADGLRPIDTLFIRTHNVDEGSDFFVTDVSLEQMPVK